MLFSNVTIDYRNWQERRVACTGKVIAFARVGESALLDAIPLFEVMSIEAMKSVEQRGEQQGHKTNNYESVIDFTHAFQIRTVKNGQNAGRKYILRGSSDEEVATIIGQLSELAKIAAEKEAAKSWREIWQLRIREVYMSSWFQAMSALLIVAVSEEIFLSFNLRILRRHGTGTSISRATAGRPRYLI